MIEASAGCGKTYKIEEIVLSLLEEGLELKDLVIVTFTNSQAADLKKRLYNRLKSTKTKQAERAFKLFEEANISTLHSLAQKVLYEMGPSIDFNPESISSFKDFKIKFASLLKSIPAEYLSNGQIRKHLNNPESLLKKIHNLLGKPVELKTSAEFKETFLKLLEPFSYREIEDEVRSLIPHFKKIEASSIEGFSSLKYKNFDAFLSWKIPLFENGEKLKKAPIDLSLSANLKKLLQDLKELQEQALSDETIINTLVFFCRNERSKRSEDVYVFDDLIFKLDELSEDEGFREAFKKKYPVAIIDEFQDTDNVQWRIFHRLFERLYIVGDPKQAIYRFRNADIYTYFEAAKSISHKLTLDTNYRTVPSLIDKLNLLFQTPMPLFRLPQTGEHIPYQPVKAGKKLDGGHLEFVVGEDQDEFFRYITTKVAEDVPSQWACLVKTNDMAKALAKQFSDCGIPYLVQRKGSMAFSRAGIALHQILNATKRQDLIRGALLSPLMRYSFEEINQLQDLNLFSLEVERFSKYKAALHRSFADFINAFEDDFLRRIANDPPLFYEWEGLVEEILLYSQKNEWKDYFLEADLEEEKRFIGDPSGVKIMTIHASKGLEFDKVFVLGMIESVKRVQEEEELAELMRLMYVALTRAKTEIYIPHSSSKNTLGSKFFEHYGESFDLSELAKKLDSKLTNCPPCYPSIKRKTTFIEEQNIAPSFQKEDLVSYTLLKKRNKNILTLNEESLPRGSEMGIFLHQVLEKIDFSLAVDLSSYLTNTSFSLYQKDIEKMLNNLLNAPLINKKSLNELSKCRQLREISFTYPKNHQMVHGVIDLIIEVEGEIYLIDWKSHALSQYDDESLKAVVQNEGFDLQAEFYYEAAMRHFGKVKEVLFVFIRGPGVYRWIR